MRRGFSLVILLVVVMTGCSSRAEDVTENGLHVALLPEVGDGFDRVSAGPHHLIALDGAHGYYLDPATGAPTSSEVDLPAVHTRRAVAADGAVWFTSPELDSSGMRMPRGGPGIALDMPAGLNGAGVAVSEGEGWLMAPFQRKAVPFGADGVAGEPVDVPCDMVVTNSPLPGGDGAVWTYCEEGVARIDTVTRTATLVDIGGRPTGLARTDSAVWAARDGRLYAIDPGTGDVTQTVDRPDAAKLAGSGNDLWVTGGGITLHSGSDGSRTAGPVGLPTITDQVGTAISELAAFDGRLYVTLNFYGTPLVMVDRTS